MSLEERYRLIVKICAVFDRIHSRAQRVFDPRSPMCMRLDLTPQQVSRLHDGSHFG